MSSGSLNFFHWNLVSCCMICFTQLIYLKPGCEKVFHQFEDCVLPLLDKHRGTLLYRARPAADVIIESKIGLPYEIHLVSFESSDDFNAYMDDEDRKRHLYLKENSVEKVILVEGEMRGYRWE
jgi:hypothetical protein